MNFAQNHTSENSSNEANLNSEKTLIYCEPSFLVREALSSLLTNLFGYKVLKLTTNAEETIRSVTNLSPSLLITEVELDGPSGIEVIHQLKNSNLLCTTIVLTNNENDRVCKQALEAGAQGYILKSDRVEELKECMLTIENNQIYTSSKIQKAFSLTSLWSGDESKNESSDPLSTLSPREREVFHLLANGKSNVGIAEVLYISPRTVETHRSKKVRKLGLQTNAEIIMYAVKNGLTVV